MQNSVVQQQGVVERVSLMITIPRAFCTSFWCGSIFFALLLFFPYHLHIPGSCADVTAHLCVNVFPFHREKIKKKRDNFCINKTTTIVVSFSIWPLGFYLFLSFSGGSLFVMAPLIKRDVISWRVYMNTIDTKGRMYNYQAIAKTSAPLCFSHFFNRVPSIYLSRLRYNGEQWRIYTPDRHIYECVYVQYIQVMDSPPHFPAGTSKIWPSCGGPFARERTSPYHVCVYIAISLKVAHIIYDTIHNMNAAATV